MTAFPVFIRACFSIFNTSSALNFSITTTLHLLSSALFKLNEGFSVVAPIRIIVPFSTWGRNVSCCSLLNLKQLTIYCIVLYNNINIGTVITNLRGIYLMEFWNHRQYIEIRCIGSQLRQEIKFLLQFHNVAKKKGTNKNIPFYWTHTEMSHHVSS